MRFNMGFYDERLSLTDLLLDKCVWYQEVADDE